jgi:RNA polymerase sigma factor (TIGR02999 family)
LPLPWRKLLIPGLAELAKISLSFSQLDFRLEKMSRPKESAGVSDRERGRPMTIQETVSHATVAMQVGEMRYNHPPSMDEERGEVTLLLNDLRNGTTDAESRLLSVVYSELKRLARSYLRHERASHTLGVTDLVHEVYLRLAGGDGDWQDRTHFFRVAAQAMRRILVDHARAHKAQKRGGGNAKIAFEDALFMAVETCGYLVEVDEALNKLSLIDARQARVVELRFFGDMSIEEIAAALQCSARTVTRDWRFAQAWLRRELMRNGEVCKQSGGNA